MPSAKDSSRSVVGGNGGTREGGEEEEEDFFDVGDDVVIGDARRTLPSGPTPQRWPAGT